MSREFYSRHSPDVARDLLGNVLTLRRGSRVLAATIIETEAYLGAEDAASHAFRGPTRRAAIMFGPAGVAYVYFIYGMYHCLNAVTGSEGEGEAVLIRGLSPLLPKGWPASSIDARRLAGPGRLCREFGIDLAMNGWDLTSSRLRIVEGMPVAPADVLVGPRIGIRSAAELQLRFRIAPAPEPRR
ncbi:MAG: DNA-3-methyladenine glycosylase [Candidatus Dormiibacterota bacterium]